VLTELGRFNGARRHMLLLSGWGALLTVAGLPLAAPGAGPFPLARVWPDAGLPAGLGVAGPALLLGGAALLTAAMVAKSRSSVLAVTAIAGGTAEHAGQLLRRAALPAAWPQTALALMLGAVALAGAIAAARTPGLDGAGPAALVAGGLCIAAAFPLVVLERTLAGIGPAELPEGAEVARLLRVPVAALLVAGVACLLQAAGYHFQTWVLRGTAVFIGLASAEVVIRAAAGLFLPPAPADAPRHAVRSSLARLIRAAPPTFSALGGEIERQFGIDLSRSWALGFLRRAALPALAGIALAGWLLTGVTALRMDERAVYHRLGVPVSVLQPGLHAHLPWPFGTVRKVELDVMHELPLVVDAAGAAGEMPGIVGAEELPPASADRLWDQAHPSEAAYLVAGLSGGQQSFQVVDIDLRLMFRAGASDQAARDLATQADPPGRLMRAAAGRVLVRYFAARTLEGVLGADRDAFAAEVRGAVQADLDALGSGLDLVAVVVEAVHPPPGAAAAYQSVQASGIRSRELVSAGQAGAARTVGAARNTAGEGVAAAQGAAAEAVSEAQVQRQLFGADRTANRDHPASFLFERRLDRLGAGLRRSQLLVLDHRLQEDALTLDMRPPTVVPMP